MSSLLKHQTTSPTNPFSTRWVKPGAIAYCFPADIDSAAVIARLQLQNWRGAIIGPHGSGKSTLLAELLPAIERAGRSVHAIALHDRQRNLPRDFLSPVPRNSPAIIVVDGYEQLGWWPRRGLHRACQRNGWGMLVTAHGDSAVCRLPVLYRTAVDLPTLQHIVDRLLPPHGGAIQPGDVAAAFHAHRGNVRESLFALYDVFEQRRRSNGGGL